MEQILKCYWIVLTLVLGHFSAQAAYETELIVAKDGSGNYTSIQDALDATKSFPDQTITIFIKAGVYNEKVRIYPWNTNLRLIGDDPTRTIITYNDHFKKISRGRNSTFHTYTLSVEANDITIKNLTIQNTAGSVGQAIAVSVSGDRCTFENCRLKGHQDTLYCTGEHNRQYFKHCHIEGTTDFIFGNATAFFDRCTIHALANSYITAASTTPRQAYGFVFSRCQLTATDSVDRVYLGRPWRAFAKTVFIACDYDAPVLPEGWKAWSNEEHLQTTFYAEYTDTDTSGRVTWSQQLSKRKARHYRIDKVLGKWIHGLNQNKNE